MSDLLTFAAAMALDPSDVECMVGPAAFREWEPLVKVAGCWTLEAFISANASFRRARPRRSRVQDMATQYRESRGPSSVEAIIEHAIRAVCEYLRTKQAEEMAGPCGLSLPETQAVWAARIEREFLEER